MYCTKGFGLDLLFRRRAANSRRQPFSSRRGDDAMEALPRPLPEPPMAAERGPLRNSMSEPIMPVAGGCTASSLGAVLYRTVRPTFAQGGCRWGQQPGVAASSKV